VRCTPRPVTGACGQYAAARMLGVDLSASSPPSGVAVMRTQRPPTRGASAATAGSRRRRRSGHSATRLPEANSPAALRSAAPGSSKGCVTDAKSINSAPHAHDLGVRDMASLR